MRLSIGVGIAALLLAGCSNNGFGSGMGNKELLGTGLGAVGGGLIGNQFGGGRGKVVATAAGAVAGGVIGNSIGRQLDQRDRLIAERTRAQALERGRSGQPVAWRNPDNGNHGSYVPGPAYPRAGGQCRDYAHTVYIGGRAETMRGTACRNPDGSWRSAA